MAQPKIGIDKEIEETDLYSSCALCGHSEAKVQEKPDITVQLTEEHREITRNLKQLNFGASAQNTEIFSKLTESLGAHFKKEEKFLFPRLARALGPDLCDRLNFEHIEIMRAAQSLDEQNRGKVRIERLEKLFFSHIATEENVLFWYLDVQRAAEKRT